MGATFAEALSLLVHLDPEVLAIVWLSFQVSLGAVVLGALAARP
jgi:ABC-type tungstate transport system substrate-binding protein